MAFARPSPFPAMLKMPGEKEATWKLFTAELCPPRWTMMITDPEVCPDGSASNGTCALICPSVTAYSGAETPFISTVVPPNEVGQGDEEATPPFPKPEPKMATKAPSDTGWPLTRLAAFNTPPSATTGGA